ncbi:MAG: MogA/MoaB family molybdenum cofactor biosynthesis protein [Treponemataceae bacterium]|nr:MogA/MoaB family molybdenum cofactor biosynthesis protein [Treponemataceae bacterium]
MTIAVLTISDRASQGIYADTAGPAVMEELGRALSPPPQFRYRCIPDGYSSVLQALLEEQEADWIITVGGTGLGPRDQTPEATRAFVEQEIPGLAEYLRMQSLEESLFAVFSRGIAGYRGQTLIVNVPGSERAARFYARLMAPLLEHGLRMRRGEGH